MIDTNAVINPIILINEAVSQMAVSIQNNMNQITESISQTTTLAQANFEALFSTASTCITTFSEQFLSLAGIGESLGLTDTLEGINGQLLILNESMAATQEGFSGFFNTVTTGTGFLSDFTGIFANLITITSDYSGALDTLFGKEKTALIHLQIYFQCFFFGSSQVLPENCKNVCSLKEFLSFP